MGDVDNYNDLEDLYNLLKLNAKYNLPTQNELMIWINILKSK